MVAVPKNQGEYKVFGLKMRGEAEEFLVTKPLPAQILPKAKLRRV